MALVKFLYGFISEVLYGPFLKLEMGGFGKCHACWGVVAQFQQCHQSAN